MKFFITSMILISVGVVSLFSQVPTPHYVVIDDAQAEITMLESRNREMESGSSVFEEENRNLDSEILNSEEFIVRADTMIDQLSASAGELYTLMQSISDSETKRDLQDRMDANRKSRYDLENRKRRENEIINQAREQIENNRKKIAVNRVRGKANDQRSEFLQACIDLSISENRDVDSVLDNADRVRQEVEQLLNQQH
ncbi:MAG: hypothetical protein KAH21_11210 [Spirochaetaceae bacterium]|nr:hypothetical protein [Spirochaetaceae bacterium]